MAKTRIPSPELLRQILDYDPLSGRFIWRERRPDHFSSKGVRSSESYCRAWNRQFAGTAAFNAKLANGYLTGSIFGQTYSAHRVAWAVQHGVWPNMIDHLNGDRADNRICNLRDVTNSSNQRNAARQSNNKSGINGVFWSPRLKKWRVSIQIDGRYREIGRFSDMDDAAEARRQAERQAGGFTRRHGT